MFGIWDLANQEFFEGYPDLPGPHITVFLDAQDAYEAACDFFDVEPESSDAEEAFQIRQFITK